MSWDPSIGDRCIRPIPWGRRQGRTTNGEPVQRWYWSLAWGFRSADGHREESLCCIVVRCDDDYVWFQWTAIDQGRERRPWRIERLPRAEFVRRWESVRW